MLLLISRLWFRGADRGGLVGYKTHHKIMKPLEIISIWTYIQHHPFLLGLINGSYTYGYATYAILKHR